MKILVINSGSSSLKSKLFMGYKIQFEGHIDGIGLKTCKIVTNFNKNKNEEKTYVQNHTEAIKKILEKLLESKIIKTLDEIDAIGHRVVHGGEKYRKSILINDQVIKDIEDFSEFAPLHNPANLSGIKACNENLPGKKQVAVFDTSFHSTIPKTEYIYPIPLQFYEKYGIRKYGFHGTSLRYINKKLENIIGKGKKIIICHLGNGSSISAVQYGKSIATSMGFTPNSGVVMGTRSGDIDSGVIEHFEKKENHSIKEVMEILNKKSGLKGLCGYSDMRIIWQKIKEGDENAELALDILAKSIIKYISYYITLMNGVDAIVFTGGIGENAYYLREKILNNFSYMNLKIDAQKNEKSSELINGKDFFEITAKTSSTRVFVIPTNEELMIAPDTEKIVNNS